MSISFEQKDNELILCYAPAMGVEDILKRLSTGEDFLIKRTFWVTQSMLRESDEIDFEETLRFCIGSIGDSYTQIDQAVIDTDHRFFFGNDVKLSQAMFVAYRNISILRKIDRVISSDLYIGGEWDSKNGIPIEKYMELVQHFPKTAELDKYAANRIASILKEFFPECDRYEAIYKKFIERRSSIKSDLRATNASNANIQIELAQFTTALLELEEMLAQADGFREEIWQEKIQNILQLLYPKYILCTREVTFKGIDGYNKRPDFLLVDANGYVDILEIKKPDVQVLTRQASYRNNYVPVREFAGAIQQIEKYIFCLTSLEKSQKEVLNKLTELLPEGVVPEIVNPQGILLLGRSVDFNTQQKRDFELIKRQYKHVADIMTYDDLIQRLKNIVSALKLRR